MLAAAMLAPSGIMQAQEVGSCNCFCVIAGRNTTIDGSVLMAHNEDDSGEMMLNMYVVPRAEQRNKYLWAEFPGTSDCDHFLNEWGVAIASDGCPSREDRDDLTDGGVLYETRLTVARQARSAREAVKIIGHLVETRGYKASGRTYVIADTHEGWICSVVRGRHWVAKRIADDEVMVLPNNYIIDEVNLADTLNYYGASDIVSYAQQCGWYSPETDGRFSFKKAYCDPKYYTYEHNVIRQLCAQQYLTGKTLEPDPNTFPFAVKPNRKIGIADLIQIMQCHGENSEHKFVYKRERPWNHPVGNCTDVTVLSAIFQLRANMPREVGCVMWVCAGRPCTEPYHPWYLGITESPSCWHRYNTAEEAIGRHFSDVENKRINYPDAIYWQSVDRWANYATDWYNRIDSVQQRRDSLQNQLFERHAKFEKILKRFFNPNTQEVKHRDALENLLNAYIAGQYRGKTNVVPNESLPPGHIRVSCD